MQLARHLYYSLRGIPALGVCGAFKLLLARYSKRQFSIHPKGYPAAITIRGATSDADILCNVIVCREYNLSGLTGVRHIIDAGANIGMASIYFAKHFPEAKIIAIEPESSNYVLLQKNTSHLTNVTVMHAALWAERVPLQLVNSDSEKWGFQYRTAEAGKADILGIPIEDLIGDGIDLLKIDIEGGEKEVFDDRCEWLKQVRFLYIEVHPGCWQSVFRGLETVDYDCLISGENLLVRISPRPQK